MTKATTADGDQVAHSFDWIVSRRARLKVYTDRLECGDWTIPYDEVNEAVLTSVRSALFMPGYVLRVDTQEKTYHFGLNGGRFWKADLPFPVERKKGRLRYSAFSAVARILLFAALGYWLWQKYL